MERRSSYLAKVVDLLAKKRIFILQSKYLKNHGVKPLLWNLRCEISTCTLESYPVENETYISRTVTKNMEGQLYAEYPDIAPSYIDRNWMIYAGETYISRAVTKKWKDNFILNILIYFRAKSTGTKWYMSEAQGTHTATTNLNSWHTQSYKIHIPINLSNPHILSSERCPDTFLHIVYV